MQTWHSLVRTSLNPLENPETLSRDSRAPPESIVLTWTNTTDQARIVGLNAHLYLKVGGGVVVSVKANCIDSTAAPEAVFAREVQKMKEERIKPFEQLTLEPFERGEYRLSYL